MTFAGFSREGLQFLAGLSVNNERAWFQPRKAEYERLLKQPLEALCVALAERFVEGSIPLVADPARSPFRIYGDLQGQVPLQAVCERELPLAGRRAGGLLQPSAR